MKIIKSMGNAKLIFLIVAFKLPILCGNAQPVVKDLIPETNIVYYKTSPDSLLIEYKGDKYLYISGHVYKNGLQYTQKRKGFLKHAVSALSQIYRGNEGAVMINELEQSTNKFTIEQGNGYFRADDVCKAYANQFKTDPEQQSTRTSLIQAGIEINGGSGGIISWNPYGTVLPTIEGGQANPSLDLAHDMFHGLDANRGMLDDRPANGIAKSEWQTVYRENILRRQLGLPLRTHYSWNVDISGNFIEGSGNRLLTSANLPIYPLWYKL